MVQRRPFVILAASLALLSLLTSFAWAYGVVEKIPGTVVNSGSNARVQNGTSITLKKWADGTWTFDNGSYTNQSVEVGTPYTSGGRLIYPVYWLSLPQWNFEVAADPPEH